MSYFLVIDIGTGNTRAAIVDSNKNIVKISRFTNSYTIDSAYANGQYFMPEEMYSKIVSAIKEVVKGGYENKISAVISTSARETIILFDKDGKAYYGIPNIDRRGEKWMNEVPNHDEIYNKTGKWVTSLFSAGKLLGLKKVHKDIYDKMHKITSLSDWVGAELTGEIKIEISHACETQLFDIHKQEFSNELCKMFGIDYNILPQTIKSGMVLGNLTQNALKLTGLEGNIPFIVGGADTQMGAYGAKVNYDECVIVSGTTTPVVKRVENILIDEKKRCWTDSFCRGEGYLIETNAGSTGLNFQRYKDNFLPDVDFKTLDEKLSEMNELKVFASFGTILFESAKSLKVGGFITPTPFPQNLDRFDLAYSIMLDMAFSISHQVKMLNEVTKNENDYLYACGGTMKSPLLPQLIANLTNKRIIIKKDYEQSTIMGCVNYCLDYFKEQDDGNEILKEYICQDDIKMSEKFDAWLTMKKGINNLDFAF